MTKTIFAFGLLLGACAPAPAMSCHDVSLAIDAALTRTGPCDLPMTCPATADPDACVFGIDAAVTCEKLQEAVRVCLP